MSFFKTYETFPAEITREHAREHFTRARARRASISDTRARDARAFQTRARETREQRQARARGARARRASHHARAPRAHTSRTSRAHLAHVARAPRARTNKLSKSKISSPNGDLESLFPRAVSLFGISKTSKCRYFYFRHLMKILVVI